MYSGRKDSVMRHVRKSHGRGAVVSYTDYLTGKLTGFYPPGKPPTFVKREPQAPDDLKLDQRAFRDGYWNEAGREAYRRGERPHL
jgi:hypothetical protein